MLSINQKNVESWNMKMRPMFGLAIKELVKQHSDIMLVVADSGRVCRIDGFPDQPNQYVDCGIAEQNMIGVAAGLARCGKIPFVFAFAPFACERCFEQIRIDAAYSKLRIIIVGSEGGVGMGTQGVTHFGWEDMAVMRSLPNMTVLCPADNAELVKCMLAAIDRDGPTYIRLSGGKSSPVYREEYDFRIGKAVVHKIGDAVNIIAAGAPVAAALAAARQLEAENISCGVTDMHSLKPLDEETVLMLAQKAPCLVTMEEHSVVNGLGSAVADVLAAAGSGCRLVKMGLPDSYPGTVSPYSDMMKDYGLTVENLVAVARETAK